MIKNICIFASSSNYLDEEFYKEASVLGKILAQNGFGLVYGGSRLGIMWACAGIFKENSGYLTGVMPEKLNDCGVSAKICDEFYLTSGMRERKAKMDELSDAVIALPGGFGTLEEVSEIIVQKQLCYNNKAIVFLNTNGFYDNLIKFMDEIIDKNFANKASRNLYYVAQTPQDAIEYLKKYQPEERTFNKEVIYKR